MLAGWKQGCAGTGEQEKAAGAELGSSPCSPAVWVECRGSSPGETPFSGSFLKGGGLGAGGVGMGIVKHLGKELDLGRGKVMEPQCDLCLWRRRWQMWGWPGGRQWGLAGGWAAKRRRQHSLERGLRLDGEYQGWGAEGPGDGAVLLAWGLISSKRVCCPCKPERWKIFWLSNSRLCL